MKQLSIAVIGAGIVGLTTAVQLAEQGHQVTIVADRYPRCLTVPEDYTADTFDVLESADVLVSDVACASFIPHTSNPTVSNFKWLKYSASKFWSHSNMPETGVKIVAGREYLEKSPGRHPWWSTIMQDFELIESVEQPAYKCAFSYKTAIVDSSVYLPWLASRFFALGGFLRRQRVESLPDFCAEAGFNIVVNCSGMGSKQLCGDPDMIPVFGQVLRVSCPSIKNWYRDSTGPHRISYVYPRNKDCIFGGTSHEDPTGECEATEDAAQSILERCMEIMPKQLVEDIKLGKVSFEVLGTGAGWRPRRASGIRCEVDAHLLPEDSQCVLIHNYGHGGEGYCFSWGCAAQVAEFVKAQQPVAKL